LHYLRRITFNLKGQYDEEQNNPIFFSVLDMLSILPITYSKYSDRKNPHLITCIYALTFERLAERE